MTSPEDLSFLLQPQEPQRVFYQAQIITFNSLDGTNTVNLAGAVLTNLPLLNIGDTINLLPGDVVILMRMDASFAILGRVLIPGSAAISSTAISTASVNVEAFNFALSTSPATLATATISVPPWANTCTVNVQGGISAQNTTGAADFLYAAMGIDGLFGAELFTQIGAGGWGEATSTSQRTIIVTPGGTVTVGIQGRVQTANWTAQAPNHTNGSATATFTKI